MLLHSVVRRAPVALVLLLASCSSMRGPFVDLFRDKEEPAWIEIEPAQAPPARAVEGGEAPDAPPMLAARLGSRAYRAVAYGYGLAVTADGHLASAHADGFVRVWGSDGERAVEVEAHEGGARDVAVEAGRLHSVGWDGRWLAYDGATPMVRGTKPTPLLAIATSGKRVAVGGLSGAVYLFDGAAEHELAGHGDRVEDLAFSPDGGRLASASWDKSVRIYDVANPNGRPRVLKHGDALFAVVFSPDGQRVATGGRGSRIALWDAVSGKKLTQWKVPGGGITALVFDGEAIVSTSAEGVVAKWSARGEAVWSTEVRHELRAVARLGDAYAIGGASGRVRFFDAASGEERRREDRLRGEVSAVQFSADDRRVVVGSSEGSVAVYAIDGTEQVVLHPFDAAVLAVAFESDGFAAVTKDALVRFEMSGAERARHDHRGVTSAIFAPDGASVLVANGDSIARVKVPSGERAEEWPAADALLAASFAPVARVERRGTEAVFDGRKLELPARVVAAALARDASRVAAVSVAKGDAFDVAFGPPDALRLVRVPATDLRAAAFDRAGERLVLAGPYRFVRPQVLSGGRWVLGPAPAPDIVAPKVIDLGSGRAILLRGHDGGVRAVAFGNTSALLATGGCDGTVRVWRVDAAF